MKKAAAISTGLHVAVLLWALVSFSGKTFEVTPAESLPVFPGDWPHRLHWGHVAHLYYRPRLWPERSRLWIVNIVSRIS